MNAEELKNYGNELFHYLNSNYPRFKEVKDKTNTLHLRWADGIVFLTFLQYVLKKDENERIFCEENGRKWNGGMFHYFLALRSIGFSLYSDEKFGFRFLITKEKENGTFESAPLRSMFETDDEFNSWIEPLREENNQNWLKSVFWEMKTLVN